MVVDTSALVAILKAEPEAAGFLVKLATATVCRLSAANFVEAGLIANRDPTGAHREALEDLLREFDIRIEPVSERQARLAVDAFRRYGKGTGHPASRGSWGKPHDVFHPAITHPTASMIPV